MSTPRPSAGPGTAVEPILTLDPGPGPRHARLTRAIRHAVREGRLREGDRLPPTRELAERLGVSRGVVTESFAQLIAEGYLTARTGSGTYVAAAPGSPATSDPSARAHTSAESPSTLLSPRLGDLSRFPREEWRRSTARVLASAGHEVFGPPPPGGLPVLREAVADYVRRLRGLAPAGTTWCVTPGSSAAIEVVVACLARRRHARLAVEDPGWPFVRESAERAGIEVVPIPVDTDGLDVAHLDRVGADAVYLTPNHHYPTGAVLSPERRRALLEWAERTDGLVLEDDYDAEFRYDQRPHGAVAALDPRRVVYVGSVSKTLGPGLRLGWAAVGSDVPADAVAGLVDLATSVSTLDQLVLADLVVRGAYDRHLRQLRSAYAARRTRALDHLAALLPGEVASPVDAGVLVLWRLPDTVDEDALVARAHDEGLAVLGLRACWSGPRRYPGLLVGIAAVPDRLLEECLVRLGGCLPA